MSMLRKWVKKIPGAFRLYQTIYPWIAPDRHPYQVASWVRRNLAFAEKNRLSEMVFGQDGAWVRDETGLEFLYLPEWQGGVGGLEFGRRHEAAEISLVLDRLKPGSVVLDIGANIGFYAIRIAHSVTGARVYAFEPVDSTFEVLQKNIRRNRMDGRILAFRIAMGDTDGDVLMTSNEFTGDHLVVPGVEGRGKETVRSVPSMRLDTFLDSHGISRVDFIKCDVEGAEQQVLFGASQCLERHHPDLLLEIEARWTARYGYGPEAIFGFLEQRGYAYLRITEKGEILPPSGSLERDLSEGRDFHFSWKSGKHGEASRT